MTNKNNLFKRVGVFTLALLSCFVLILPVTKNITYAETSTISETLPSQEIRDYIINNGYYKSENLCNNSLFEWGDILSNGSYEANSTTVIRSKNYIPVKEGAVYTLSANKYTDIMSLKGFSDVGMQYATGSFATLSSGGQYTIPIGTHYVRVVVRTTDQTIGLENYEVQLEEGSFATPYKPYKNEIYQEGALTQYLCDNYNNSHFLLNNIEFSHTDAVSGEFCNYFFNIKLGLLKPVPYNIVLTYLVNGSSYLYYKNYTFTIQHEGNGDLYDLSSVNLDAQNFIIKLQAYNTLLTNSEINDLVKELYKINFSLYYVSDIVTIGDNSRYVMSCGNIYNETFLTNEYLLANPNYDFVNETLFNNQLHYDNGYNDGYVSGYNKGVFDQKVDIQTSTSTFKDMVFSIFDAPFNVLANAFDFEILGINIGSFLQVVVSLLLIAFAIKIFI